MIIGPESPLRFLPAAMERRQALMFEGIRFSIQMADLAHARLRETLLGLTDAIQSPHEEVGRALEDAWSIIDSISRLKGILQQAPGITHRDRWPSIRRLVREMGPSIDSLRNVFQHLDQDVALRVHQDWPLFGILHWFRLNTDGNSGRICALMGGTIAAGQRPLMNIHGKRLYETPLGMIELQTEGASISISDLMEVVGRIAGDFERSLTEPRDNRAPSDSLIHIDIQFVEADLNIGREPEEYVV